MKLASDLSENVFELCDRITHQQAVRTLELCTAKQTRKYEDLLQRARASIRNSDCRAADGELIAETKTVINLSKQTLDCSAESVLTKGLNFAPTPKRIPVENIIGSVEECLARAEIARDDAELIRQDVSVIIRKAKMPVPNVNNAEMNALRDLAKNDTIMILPADKGNATVILDTEEYKKKITNLLSDESTYCKIKYDPTNRIERKTRQLISTCRTLFAKEKGKLLPSCIQPPKIYGLPKVHKPNVPLRPIVSQIDSPTYCISKIVAGTLKQLRGTTSSFIKDSTHFVSLLQSIKLEENEIMVSFDVESLFTNVPVRESIDIVKSRLESRDLHPDWAIALELCLTSGYFLYGNDFYQQVSGVAMGSPVSPVVADIFMEYFEAKAIDQAPIKPKIWLRYVDDTFCIIKEQEVHTFLQHINSVHPKIRFSMERENQGSLPFLDVKVLRKEDGSLGHTVYRKNTHTDRYLHATSHHHPANLRSVVSTLLNRAHRICDPEHLSEELKHLDQVLKTNGYNNQQRQIKKIQHVRQHQPMENKGKIFLPYMKGVSDRIGRIFQKHNIKPIYMPPRKIGQYLGTPKTRTPLLTPGVYSVPCTCGLSYVGQTKRSVSTRLNEHIKATSKKAREKSAICEHLMDNPDHFIHFEQAKILAREKHLIPRLVHEAIEIKRTPNFNREDSFKLSRTWDPILHKLKPNIHKTKEKTDTVSVICREDHWTVLQQQQQPQQRYNLRSNQGRGFPAVF